MKESQKKYMQKPGVKAQMKKYQAEYWQRVKEKVCKTRRERYEERQAVLRQLPPDELLKIVGYKMGVKKMGKKSKKKRGNEPKRKTERLQ